MFRTLLPLDLLSCASASRLLVTFLWRSEDKPIVENEAISNAYGTAYYKDAVAWADSNGVLSGSANQFVPDNNCPRADIVTYMYYTVLDTYNLSTDGIISNDYRNFVEIDGKMYEADFLCDKWRGFYADKVTGETYIDIDNNNTSTPYSGLTMLAALLEGNYEVENSDNPFTDGLIFIDGSDTSLKLTVDTHYVSAAVAVDKCTYERNGAVLESAELIGTILFSMVFAVSTMMVSCFIISMMFLLIWDMKALAFLPQCCGKI